MSRIALAHVGYAGLRLTWPDGAQLLVDPPAVGPGPVVVTWTERERVEGARAATGPLAAASAVLDWLGRRGIALDGAISTVGPFRVRARPYRPIPYATPPEALRKTITALFDPRRAARRLAFATTRPATPPLALAVDHMGLRAVLVGQALHRFTPTAEVDALAAWAGPAELVVAGTDYEDETATGTALARFPAATRVVADLTGTIRRELGLPVRPLQVAIAAAPAGTRRLGPGEQLRADSSRHAGERAERRPPRAPWGG